MPVLNVQNGSVGLVDVLPTIAYINTNDTVAEILATGYLNSEVNQGASFTLPCLAHVITRATPTAPAVIKDFQVTHVLGNWSLVPLNGTTKFAVQYTTVGGAAAEVISVPGILATDLASVQVVDNGTGNVTVLQAVCTANTLTVTFSGNPGADTIINYFIYAA